MCSTATSTSLADRVRAMASELPDVGLTGDAELRTRLVALEEARNIVEAEQAAVMVEMHGRAESEDAARDAAQAPGIRSFASTHEARMTEFVSDEIAVLLACTPMLATHRLETAIGANAHPSLMRVWRRGAIDARKVAVIGDSLRDVDPAFADTLAEEAARYATSRTATQTRAWLTRQVLAADPGMAEVRRARANEGRHITLRPVGDGMAELCALLPGVQARQAFDTINALAQAAPKGDARTADQRRADALMDLLTGRAEPPQVKVQVVVSADTLAGESDSPGWVPGLGPITAGEARQIVRGAGPMTCSPLIADPDTGMLADRTTGTSVEPQYRPSAELDRAVRARDLTCRFPGCRRSALGTASGTDLDHTAPWPQGPTTWGNLAVLCRRHHRLKHSAGWQAELSSVGIMTWTTPTGRHYVTEPWHYLEPPDTG